MQSTDARISAAHTQCVDTRTYVWPAVQCALVVSRGRTAPTTRIRGTYVHIRMRVHALFARWFYNYTCRYMYFAPCVRVRTCTHGFSFCEARSSCYCASLGSALLLVSPCVVVVRAAAWHELYKKSLSKAFCFSQVTSEWFCFSAVIPSSDHLWVECFVSAMAGQPPKRRAEDQHSISSFFRTKRPDKDMEAATSVSSEEERIDDEPCFDVNVVEEQSPSGVASGGEVTSAAGDMVQCQSRSETSSSCQTQYNKLVFKALSGESCTEEEKRSIIAGRTPPTNCDLPYTLVRDQRKQSGYSKRFLQRQSFANFD